MGKQTAVKGKAKKATPEGEPEDRAVALAQKPGSPAVNPESLLAECVRGKASIEVVERILALRIQLKAEWAREQYFTALAQFQAACPIIVKTKCVYEKDGQKVRYCYAPLESIVDQVKVFLKEYGFSYTTKTAQGAGHVTALLHAHHRDGHSEVTELTIPIDVAAYMSAPQKVGSALTYATRYAFRDAFGILTGDDDDDGAGEPENGKPPAAEPPRTSARNVTPAAAQTPPPPEEPAGRKLPPQLAGIKPVGAECYWLLHDNHQKHGGVLSEAYAETQGTRLSKNRGNEQFLSMLKVEIEATITEAKNAKEKTA